MKKNLTVKTITLFLFVQIQLVNNLYTLLDWITYNQFFIYIDCMNDLSHTSFETYLQGCQCGYRVLWSS